MTNQLTLSQYFFRLLSACGISLLIASGSSAAIAASNSDACALLKPADLTALLGGKPIANSNGSSCRWTSSGSNRKLMAAIIKLKTSGVTSEMAYAGARQNAHRTGKVTDESGLGDKAFAVVTDSGLVVMMIIKQGRLLQLQYMTGAAATSKDLDALRPVAKKAIAAL